MYPFIDTNRAIEYLKFISIKIGILFYLSRSYSTVVFLSLTWTLQKKTQLRLSISNLLVKSLGAASLFDFRPVIGGRKELKVIS
jgi:hypothetical protein